MSVPAWLEQLVEVLPTITGEQLSRFLPPETGGRQAAVLVLLGEGPEGPDVLLSQRASTLRAHAGQPAFPGGSLDPSDAGPAAAALREAYEEVGLDPDSVEVLGVLPALWLPPSGFVVTPVLAWWRTPHAVGPVDPGEVAAVWRVPVAHLTDPERRVRVTHPSGYSGPGFETDGMLVWGFTAGILDKVLAFAGWERPWDPSRTALLDPEAVRLSLQTTAHRRTTP